MKTIKSPAILLAHFAGDTPPFIRVTEKAFDDFAGAGTDQSANRRMLGVH